MISVEAYFHKDLIEDRRRPTAMEGFTFEESDFWLDISSVQMYVNTD